MVSSCLDDPGQEAPSDPAARFGVARGRAWGTTTGLVVLRPEALSCAQAILRDELESIDRACSRFRPDAEIWHLYGGGGAPVQVSPMLFELVSVACDLAQRTAGALDPTVGCAVASLGYDRDFAEVAETREPLATESRPAPGWWGVELDPVRCSIRVPAGTLLDLGATAKALAADRAAVRVASATGSGVLVELGGDVAVSGPPPEGGWPVRIAARPSTPLGAAGPVVGVASGGLATSSTTVRRWRRGEQCFHHIVDPATGKSASWHWQLVSVAAATCVEANAASTAAIVWGESAAARLEALALPSRLVRHDGTVIGIAGWPADVLCGTSARPQVQEIRC